MSLADSTLGPNELANTTCHIPADGAWGVAKGHLEIVDPHVSPNRSQPAVCGQGALGMREPTRVCLLCWLVGCDRQTEEYTESGGFAFEYLSVTLTSICFHSTLAFEL